MSESDTTAVKDLRRRAGELDIAGRSAMGGEQLAAAIAVAERSKDDADAAIAALNTREQTYAVSRLRRHPEILGVGRAEFAAALADADVSDSATLTREQAANLIARSQKRIVQTQEA